MKRRRSLFIHLSYIRILAKKFAIVILFLTAFALMLLNKTESVVLEKTSSLATDVISPVVDLLVVPARMVAGVYDYFAEIKEVYKDNQDLREENKKLLGLYDKMKVLEVENRLLANLLNSSDAAATIGKTVEIDTGSDVSVTGTVEAVTRGSQPQVQVNGMLYDVNSIKTIYAN